MRKIRSASVRSIFWKCLDEHVLGVCCQLQLSTISRSVLLCVAMSLRSSAGFGTLRWRVSQPGIQPHPYTCQARVESFPHAAVRGNTLDPPPHCLFGGTPLSKALSRLSRSPRLFLEMLVCAIVGKQRPAIDSTIECVVFPIARRSPKNFAATAATTGPEIRPAGNPIYG